MSNEKHETVADIMSEMREYADNMEKHLLYDLRECATDYLRVLADRIEAADHRFREITKMIPHEEAAAAEMETTTPTSEKSSVVGDAAAMHEALNKILWCLEWMSDNAENKIIKDHLAKPIELAKSALSAPTRNCNVGTVDEQAERFYSFCKKYKSGIQGMCSPLCPCKDCCDKCHCLVKWAQMPYEEA